MFRRFSLLICLGVVAVVFHPAPLMAQSSVLFSEHFDNSALSSRGWYDSGLCRIATTGTFAGPGCIEYEWRTGGTGTVGSGTWRHQFTPSNSVYIRLYMKLSTGWGWSGQSYHPHMFHFLTNENDMWMGPASTHLTLYVEFNAGKLRLGATDMQNANMPHGLTQGPLVGGYNGKLYDSQSVLLKDDKWHCVEAFFQLNTLDMANDHPNQDAIYRGWFDGVQVINVTNAVMRTTDFPNMKFNQFLMAPYFGPGLLPHAQKMWVDEMTVGTQAPGPPAVADAGPDETEYESSSCTLDGSASANANTYAWTQVSGKAVALQNANTAHPFFVIPRPATQTEAQLTFRLTVTNADSSDTDEVTIRARLMGDANGDDKVDSTDLGIWQQNYDSLGRYPHTPADGDFNGDGKVDSADLAVWQRHYDPAGLAAPSP